MAHVAKFPATSAGHLANHYSRSELDQDGILVIRSNERIDPQRTYLNYNLAEHLQPLPAMDFIRQRLGEVKCQKRKDVNIMCDWVVTAPQDLLEQDQPQFFQSCFDFLCDRYGQQNVISAYVHMDETTPHIHFAFIPVVPDTRRGGFKVSAKECLTRHDLQTFHPDLAVHLQRDLHYSVQIMNGATQGGNRSVLELKTQDAERKLHQTSEMASRTSQEARKAQMELEAVQGSLIEAQAEYDALRAYIEQYQQSALAAPDVKPNKSIGGRIKSYTVPADVWEAQQVALGDKAATTAALKAFDEKIENLKKHSFRSRLYDLQHENNELRDEVSELRADRNDSGQLRYENRALRENAQKREAQLRQQINDCLKKLPEDAARQFVEEWEKAENRRRDRGFSR